MILKVRENFYLGHLDRFHSKSKGVKIGNQNNCLLKEKIWAKIFCSFIHLFFFSRVKYSKSSTLEAKIIKRKSKNKVFIGNIRNSFYQSLLSKAIASKNRCLLKNHFAIMRTTYDWLFNSLHKIMIKSSQTQRRRPKKRA